MTGHASLEPSGKRQPVAYSIVVVVSQEVPTESALALLKFKQST